jgi:SAM-dependent methyltransferase
VRHEDWLRSGWSFVRPALPPPPGDVLEIGCGSQGGFVPALLADGYTATGIDPDAPEGTAYVQAEFEGYDPPRAADAVVASTSLHHVADLGVALDRVAAVLKPGGTAVIIEWDVESFDEPTARWCFDRLPAPGPADEPGWLHRRRDEWLASGQSWPDYIEGWRAGEGLHPVREILRGLDARFSRRSCDCGPYFFPDLDQVTEAGEQAAIDAGQIRATRIHYTGTLRSR